MELQNDKLLLYPKYCPIHNKIVRTYKELNIEMPKIYEINYGESIISIVKNTDYATVLPKSLAMNKISSNKDIYIKELDVPFMRNISIFSNNKFSMDLLLKKIETK